MERAKKKSLQRMTEVEEEIDTEGQCQVLSDRMETEQADSIDTESDKSNYSRSVIRSAKF